MRTYIFLFLFLTLGLSGLFAQNDNTLSGQILGKDTEGNLPGATIVVLSNTGEIITGNITDEEGRFIISGLKVGSYNVRVSFVGYDDYIVPVLIGELNNNYDLGKVRLESSATELDNVNIIGQRSEISASLDRKSYDLSSNIAQSGGSVMDAMKAMPGITFDQEGKAILRGSDKVLVLIDNKQSSLTGYGNQKGLDNIPAANVERIEIINNPSAKYDASGMAGIINIVYKKELKYGLHGSVGLAYGLGALSKPKADLPTELGSYSPTPKYIPSLDLSYTNEKINVFFQGEIYQQNRLPNNEFTTRYYDDGRVTASQVPENRTQTHYIVKGGIDYNFNEQNKLTISGIYDWENHVDTAQVKYLDVNTGIANRYIAWNENEITGIANVTINYEHKFKQPGHIINTSLIYSKNWEDETYYINELTEGGRNGRDVTSILGTEHITSLNTDYTKPLRSGRIEAGAKVQIRNLPVEYTQTPDPVETILYPNLGDWSKWGENTYAGYLNLVHEKTKYEVEAGLRYEYNSVFYNMDPVNIYFMENDAYNYFNLFPNVRLAYKINPRHKVSLFYNSRIDRPGEPELRMYPKSDDHELVKVGNPYLRPQLTKTAEIAYKTNWESGSLFIAGYARFIDDPYMRIYTQDTTNTDYDIVLKSYANTGKATNMGVELVFNQQVFEFWELSGNANFYQNKIHEHEGILLFPYEHSFSIAQTIENTWDMKMINTFDLSEDFQIQLSGMYVAPKNIPQGKELSRSSIDLGIKKFIWNKKGELTLSVSDMFNKYGLRQDINGDGFRAVYENYYETQIIRIGLKYKF